MTLYVGSTKIANTINRGSNLVTKEITTRGIYFASSDNADGYSSVMVNVPEGNFIKVPREVSASGIFQVPTSNFSFILPEGTINIGEYAMCYAFYNCISLEGSLNLSSLTTVSGTSAMYRAFYGCTSLTDVDLSSLTTVSGTSAMSFAFYGCTSLTSVDLSSLTTVSGNNAMNGIFYTCASLEGSLNLGSLTVVSGSQGMYDAFNNCRRLTSVDLSSLTTVSGDYGIEGIFDACTSLTSVDLSSLTVVSGIRGMQTAFRGCSSLSFVNFPNLETIGADVPIQNNSHFVRAFLGTSVTSLTFPELKEIYCTGSSASQGTFVNNTTIQKMYFPKLDTITYGKGASSSNQVACQNIFYGCTALTELHFCAENQEAIEASLGYSTAWGRGAGNVTIYFDL